MPVISKELFRRIEHELYNYQDNVRKLNERRAEAIYGTPRHEEGRSKGCASDPTAMRGIKLAKLDESEQARWLECIHAALENMPRELKMLVKLTYFDGFRWWQVAERMHVSRSLYFAWRENAVMHVVLAATQMGLIEPVKFQEKNAG